jgi:hypothetical protein
MAKPFDARLQALYTERQEFCRSMDEVEANVGFASPIQLSPVQQLRTALFALEAGLLTSDKDTCGDALVLLHELLEVMAAAEPPSETRRVRPRGFR